MEIERRSVPAEVRAVERENGLPKLEGYAIVYDSLSQDLGGFRELIRPGALTRSIGSMDIRAIYNHNWSDLLGRSGNKTLTLTEDDHGLRCEIDLPDTTVGRDVAELIRRGDLTGMSFGFVVTKEEMRSDKKDGTIREVHEMDLYEVSPCPDPAYLSSTVSVRARRRANEFRREKYDRLIRLAEYQWMLRR